MAEYQLNHGTPAPTAPVAYSCGDCGQTNEIRAKQAIRCHECGCRVMFKKRSKKMVQFEAR